MSEEGKINLFVRDKSVCIWTSDDWKLMRSNRVMGHFVGNLAALPRQDLSEGLPLALLPEEATLLMEKGLAQFVHAPSLSRSPSDRVRDESQSFRKNLFSEQVNLLKERRKKEIEKNIDQIVQGKIMKMKNTSESNSTFDFGDRKSLTEKILLDEYEKIETPKASTLSVQIFTRDPWLSPNDYVQYEWKYPETDDDRLHYLTYKDLWEQGYYITPGKKFGADYLVYPGDPAMFHSFFIVICTSRERELKASQLIMYGRLGQSVRKTFVLAYLTDNGEVKYQSIQWMGL